MKMIVTVAFTLFALITGCNLYAQNTIKPDTSRSKIVMTPEKRAQMQTENMKKSLTLTDEQAKSVHDIIFKYDQKLSDSFKTNSSAEGRKEAFKKINEDKDAELKKALAPEQFAKYQQNKQQAAQRRYEAPVNKPANTQPAIVPKKMQ